MQQLDLPGHESSQQLKQPKFVKHDENKPRFDLIDADFELELAQLLEHGARKYAPRNWQLADPDEAVPRYTAALRRHLNASARGEVYDNDSGVSHLVCVACCSMFLRWFEREATS